MITNLRPVATRRDLDAFLNVPRAIYRDDPAWVPPLLFDKRQQLSPKHPFFRHAQWQGWIAWEGDAPVGRISAQVDRLNDGQGRPTLGYFGMFEALNDAEVVRDLFKTAEDWLRARGMERVVGPFNLGINQEVGLLVEGFATQPFFMMGHARPYYDVLVQRAGYTKAKDLLAYEVAPDFEAPAVMNAMQRRLGTRMTIRPIELKRRDAELETLRDIFNDAWAENWNFVPFTEEEFRTIGREMLLLIGPEFIQIAIVDGEPAAFIVMLPNLNPAIAEIDGKLLPFGWAKLLWRVKAQFPTTTRVPLMGVRRRFHHTRLGPALAFGVIDAVRHAATARGVTSVEMSWILEDNAGMRNIIETIGGVVTKRYRMYEKALV